MTKVKLTKCCLCQTDTKEGLKSPPTRYELSSDTYSMIAKNIPNFHAINLLPIRLDPSRLDDGGDIEDTLRKNSAKYHQTCRQMFNNCKLECTTKRAAEIQNDHGEVHAKIQRASIEVQCFYLCEKMEPTSELLSCCKCTQLCACECGD